MNFANVFNANKARVAVPRGVRESKEINTLDCLTTEIRPEEIQSDSLRVSNPPAGGRERPILFSGPMVRALLDGRKTQTRRAVKGVPSWDHYGRDIMDWGLSGIHQDTYDPSNPIDGTDRWHLDVQTDVDDHSRRVIRCPYGARGDRLWVREACAVDGQRVFYRLDHEEAQARGPRVDVRWRPSIHMPRWASRLALEITEVRVERLQDISEADARAEGYDPLAELGGTPPLAWYAPLWDAINGGGAWDSNPWVWAVSFRVAKA